MNNKGKLKLLVNILLLISGIVMFFSSFAFIYSSPALGALIFTFAINLIIISILLILGVIKIKLFSITPLLKTQTDYKEIERMLSDRVVMRGFRVLKINVIIFILILFFLLMVSTGNGDIPLNVSVAFLFGLFVFILSILLNYISNIKLMKEVKNILTSEEYNEERHDIFSADTFMFTSYYGIYTLIFDIIMYFTMLFYSGIYTYEQFMVNIMLVTFLTLFPLLVSIFFAIILSEKYLKENNFIYYWKVFKGFLIGFAISITIIGLILLVIYLFKKS